MGDERGNGARDSALREAKKIEADLDSYSQELSLLREYHDAAARNAEMVIRWQDSFAEPLSHFPGGSELMDEIEYGTRKGLADLDALYDEARHECLGNIEALEDELTAKKKEINDGITGGEKR